MSKPNKIVRDSLVIDLQENGQLPENMTVLTGFIGDGETEETIRFYTDMSLSNYLIIPVDAILHQVKISSKLNPVGGSMIWVQQPEIFDSKAVLEQQAQIEQQNTEQEEQHTDYFNGNLYDQYTNQNPEQAQGEQQVEPANEGFTHTCVATYPPICLSEDQQ